MKSFRKLALTGMMLLSGFAGAITVQVDPFGGIDDGASPFATISAALAFVAGADAGSDTVNLRTTGAHALSGELSINVNSADGALTIQRDPGDAGNAVLVLDDVLLGISISLDGGTTATLQNLTFLPTDLSAGTANAVSAGDGIQISRGAGPGIGIVNITNCIFGANDGSNVVAPFTQNPLLSTQLTAIGDDWLDFFPNTVGNLTNVIVSHAGDEGTIIRGDNAGAPSLGASVSITGNSVYSYNGGRTFQAVFGGPTSGDGSEPTLSVAGTLGTRIRIYRNGTNWSGNGDTAFGEAEGTVRAFNGNLSFQFTDFYENGGAAFVVDSDTCDSFTLDCVRVAENGSADLDNSGQPDAPEGLVFLFPTDNLTTATITRTTFHNNEGDEFRVADTVSSAIQFTDCIFTGENDNDRLEVTSGSTAAVSISNSAIVTAPPYVLAPNPLVGEPPTLSAIVNLSPDYISTIFDVTDPQNANFLRVTRRNPIYDTADSSGGELRGGNCLSVVDPLAGVTSDWSNYE